MAGIAFVNGENVQHPAVVFLQIALHPFGIPVFGRRADGKLARSVGVQWRRRIHVGGGVAALEFGHFDNLAVVGLRQAEDVVGGNEILELRDAPFHHACQLFRPTMLLGDRIQHTLHGVAAALLVIRWQRLPRRILAPKLTGDDVHVALHAGELGFGVGHHLVGADGGVQLQVQLAGKPLRAQPPLAIGARQQILFEELLVVLQTLDHRLGGGFQGGELACLSS